MLPRLQRIFCVSTYQLLRSKAYGHPLGAGQLNLNFAVIVVVYDSLRRIPLGTRWFDKSPAIGVKILECHECQMLLKAKMKLDLRLIGERLQTMCKL